ncbi:substrate-binding periplasmic protein [Sporohalobacter salinus]|uniref:substrate-binding periplasmic protein n=1 Tax=Sporohalobacter salinus TaxID=1494606 RepID=UPI001961FC7D|nr:ABC transporter substrate-binding protein [Sporohalobacter salinus]MBM7623776.1 polar amino acid transport system substrate-binding protein [Sporohalobacter salinus]
MKKLAVVLVGVFLFSSVMMLTTGNKAFGADKLTIITENFPPLNYEKNGKPMGISVEIVKELQKRVGSKSNIKVLPWARGYKMTLQKPNTILFSTTRTKKREELFKWVGPLAEMKWIFLAKKDSNFKLDSLKDVKQVGSIGTVLEDVSEQTLKDLGFKNYSSTSKKISNPKKLLSGRIDLWFTSAITSKELCKQNNIDYDNFKPVYTLKSSQLYIAFNKKTSQKTINKWRKAYKQIREEGIIKKIMKKHNYEVLYPQKK